MPEQFTIPAPGTHIEVAGARRIAELGDAAPRQPEVQVVVRQQNVGGALDQVGMVLQGPEQLGDRVARRDGHAEPRQGAFRAAEPVVGRTENTKRTEY